MSAHPNGQCIMEIKALCLLLVPILAFANGDVLDKGVSDAVNTFSVDFLKEVFIKRNRGNVAVSPVSVSTLLAILHQGAGGNTRAQLTQTLRGEPEQTRSAYKKIIHSLKILPNGTILEFANGVFLNKGYRVVSKFNQYLEQDFLSEISTTNFAENVKSAHDMNKWVALRTHNIIRNVAAPGMLTTLTRMVLVNAIYFKSSWLDPFKPKDTKVETFYGDFERKVPMMHQRDRFAAGFFDDIQAQWLKMPFKGKRFYMIVVLPKTKNGLQDTFRQITYKHISKLLKDVKPRHFQDVELSIPKFRISSELQLIPILKLKTPDLFSNRANLFRITNEAIHVSEVFQKAEIEVDERGPTAPAGTGIRAVLGFAKVFPPDVIFKANHPFLVFILDTATLVLFLLPILAVANDDILDKAASDAINSFSVDFLKEVLKTNKGNVAMSPLSVSTLLAILHQGAGGNTKAQLTQALQGEPEETRGAYKKLTHSLKNVSNGTLLEFANGIFLNEGYKICPQFKQHLEEDFLSEIATANFAATAESAEKINKWASIHTHDKIKEIVKPDMLSSLTRMVLLNAIYFKDNWLEPFKPENTKMETFYGDSEEQVPMMHKHDSFKTGFLDDIQAQWLEIPFQGERFSMIVVLPKEKNGLQNTLTQLTSAHISKLLSNVKEGYAEKVILTMPKFKIASTLKLIPILRLKIPDLFSGADLSGISEEASDVSEAIQKAEIEVDERGATAAAVTAIITAAHSAIFNPAPPIVFNANHPFLVFIVDNSNRVILFAGQVSNPSLT